MKARNLVWVLLVLSATACGPVSVGDLTGAFFGEVKTGPPMYVVVHPEHFEPDRLVEQAIRPVVQDAAQSFRPLRVAIVTGGSSGATRMLALPDGGLLRPETRQRPTQEVEAEEFADQLLVAIVEAVGDVAPSQTGAAISRSVLQAIEAAAIEPVATGPGTADVIVITAGVERTAGLDLVGLDPLEASQAGHLAAAELPELGQSAREVRVTVAGIGDLADLPEPPTEALVASLDSFWRGWCHELTAASQSVVTCTVSRTFAPHTTTR